MAITNTWTIERMQCYPERDGLTDVVFTIRWRLDATDGIYSTSIASDVCVTLDPLAPYTPYDQLTQDQVISWVQSALGPDQIVEYELGLLAQIDAQATPPVISPPLPWSN